MSRLSLAIREARTTSGTGQRELARKLHISPSYLCDLEAGLRRPAISTLKALASALDQNEKHWLYLWLVDVVGDEDARAMLDYYSGEQS